MQTGVLDDPQSAKTLPQLIRAAAAAYGGDIAVVMKGGTDGDESLSFSELERKSAELAKGLLACGVGKGTRIGFIYGNSPTFVLLLATISRIGAVAIPISTLIKSNELVRVLRQSDVTGLFVQREFMGNDYVERLCEALPELAASRSPDLRMPKAPYLRWIVSSGELPSGFRDMRFFTDAAGTIGEELLLQIESEVHPADQMIEIYTSGSMALPKGVKHNHGPTLFRTHYMRSMLLPKRGQEITVQLPMFWIGGLIMYLLPNWEVGAVSVCTERTLNNSRVAMGTVLAAEDMEMLKQNKPYWGLGMTETLGPYSYGDELRVASHPLCAPLDHFADRFEVRVADSEDRPVPDGGTGEVQVRGYALTPGLHKIERDEFFAPDGFYHTGDMALVQGKRILYIGRNGDMIKTASANVSPAEVEMELQQLDGVHSAYVLGLPDKERGQLVVAALVAREGAVLDFTEIERTLRQRLSSYKVPRAYVQIAREEVPLLHSNKVSRRQFEAILKSKLGRAP